MVKYAELFIFAPMIEAGIKGKEELVVSEEMLASACGSGTVPVFATPMMVALMEKTCMTSIIPFLEEGQASVGTRLEISHESATPLGMKVTCTSELVEVDRRRLVFRVQASDECGLIGQGVHERFVIDAGKFTAKCNSKKQD